jgi:hypothetical protein
MFPVFVRYSSSLRRTLAQQQFYSALVLLNKTVLIKQSSFNFCSVDHGDEKIFFVDKYLIVH